MYNFAIGWKGVCKGGGGGYCEYNLQLYHESKGAIFVIVEKQGFNYF